MTIDWQHPFELAGQLFLFVFGWTLVVLVCLLGLALVVGLLSVVASLFKKKSVKSDEEEFQESLKSYLKSVD
jgi:pilus assembly protein TadC